MFVNLDKNLKRNDIWNSIEVHVIYGLVFTLCMSQEGLHHMKTYFSADDSKVFEPLFIAQYLFAPVNTIVKKSLLPWMMEKYEPTKEMSSLASVQDRLWGRRIKSEIFF